VPDLDMATGTFVQGRIQAKIYVDLRRNQEQPGQTAPRRQRDGRFRTNRVLHSNV
jgi:hypothetical protein